MTGFFARRFFFAAAGFFLAAANCIRADWVIVQKVEGSAQAGTMTMRIKGDKARADISPAVSTIIDAATGDVTTLMHERKTFLRITPAAAQEIAARLRQGERENGSGTRPQLLATGAKQKILGYETEKYTCEFGNVRLAYWIAKDFPNAQAILTIMKKMQSGAAALGSGFLPDPETFPGLPLKTEMTIDNKPPITTTVISVEEKPVDDSLFTVPENYAEIPPPTIPP